MDISGSKLPNSKVKKLNKKAVAHAPQPKTNKGQK